MSVCTHCATPLPDGSLFCSQCGTPVPGRELESATLTPQGREIFDRLKSVAEGRYEILRELGRGGMAVVFLGYQKSLARHVAIKVLLPILSYDAALVQRFMREARTQGKLDHPNIIPVYEVYNEGGMTFFTMPFIEGGSLRKLLVEQPRPPLERVLRYLRQAADALGYAHRRGVIHRDVKPDNMLVDEERDRIILTDFGIAKAVAMESTLTTPGDLLGTPQYMSPEQGEGRMDLDGRADLYSLGLIGYEMLAGRRPFQADNLAELMYKHRFEEPESLDRVCPDTPLSIRETITRAIQKDRDVRFADMAEFRAALAAAASAGGVAAGAPERAGPLGDEPTLRVVTPQRGRVEDVEPGKPSTPIPEWLVETTPERVVLPKRARPAGTPARRPVTPAGQPAKRAWRPLLWATPVLLLAGALYLAGPWSPLRTSTGESIAGGEEPLEEIGPPRPEVFIAETEPAAGPEELAQAGETPSEGPEAAPEAGGAETTGGRPETADPGAAAERTPPRKPAAEAGVSRAQAEEARAGADRARQSALAAGSEQVSPSGLDALDRRRTAAMMEMAAGRFAAAQEALAGLALDYARLERDVWKSRAESARTMALRERQAARGSEGGSLTHPDLDRLARNADQAYEASRYRDAQSQFLVLADGYKALAVRDVMQRQRASAQSAGAQTQEPRRLASADSVAGQAEAQFRRAAYADAMPLFERARSLYGSLASELAARPGEQPVEVTPPEERPDPAASAEDAIRDLIELFRQGMEREDLDRLGADLYRVGVPRNDAERFFRPIFDGADDLRVEAEIRRIQVETGSASAEVQLVMRFHQARVGEARTMRRSVRLLFAPAPGGWRLARLEY